MSVLHECIIMQGVGESVGRLRREGEGRSNSSLVREVIEGVVSTTLMDILIAFFVGGLLGVMIMHLIKWLHMWVLSIHICPLYYPLSYVPGNGCSERRFHHCNKRVHHIGEHVCVCGWYW